MKTFMFWNEIFGFEVCLVIYTVINLEREFLAALSHQTSFLH